MRFNEFKKLNEADDRVIAAVEFTDGTRITIRNIPRAATQSSNFENQIRARASRARPNLSFSRWSLVDDSEADRIDSAPERTYTPTAEEERDMQNVQALWDHLRNQSKASTPFTFTDSQGNKQTIENPAEMLDSEAAWADKYNDSVGVNMLRKKIITVLNADKNITTVGPIQPRQTPGEPFRVNIAWDSFQYVRAIVYNTGDQ